MCSGRLHCPVSLPGVISEKMAVSSNRLEGYRTEALFLPNTSKSISINIASGDIYVLLFSSNSTGPLASPSYGLLTLDARYPPY